MSIKKKAVVSAASAALDGIFRYIDKDPEANLDKIVEKGSFTVMVGPSSQEGQSVKFTLK